jgi:hypothetical protein
MKKWNVHLVTVYHKTADVVIRAETEQEAIELAEEILSEDEDAWSDFDLVDQYVEAVKKI